MASLNHYNCLRARINRTCKESMTHFKWMLSAQGQDGMICKAHISECFPTDGSRNNSYPKITLGFLNDSIDFKRCAQTLKDVNEHSLLSYVYMLCWKAAAPVTHNTASVCKEEHDPELRSKGSPADCCSWRVKRKDSTRNDMKNISIPVL